MKKQPVILFFILHFSLFTCVAQTHEIDSLRQAIKVENEDTNKVNTLNLLGEKLFKVSAYDSVIVYSNLAKALAEKLEFDKGLADAYNTLGTTINSQGNYTKGMMYATKGLEIEQKIGNLKGECYALNTIGAIYNSLGNLSKALENFLTELKLAQEGGIKKSIGSSLANIGLVYENQNDYPKALEYYFKALEISKEMDYKSLTSTMQSNIGGIYSDQGNYSKALEFDTSALSINQKIGYKAGIAFNYNNIGDVYEQQKNYSKALPFKFKALNLFKEMGRENEIAANYCTIGDIFTEQKKYHSAKEYLDSSSEILTRSGGFDNLKILYSSLSNLDSSEGNYKSWEEDYKNYIRYSDSLNNEKTVQEEMNYDFDRKTDSANMEQEKQNAIAANELQRQKVIRNSFVGGFSISFLAAGIFFFQRRRIAKEKKRSDELLLNILPEETAEELKATGEAKAKSYDMVTVIFTDFKDFSKISEKLSPADLVKELHYLFETFDGIIQKHNIEKIKTIGDSYMAAGGLPVANNTNAKDVVNAALEIQEFMLQHNNKRNPENAPVFEARIGINTGPVVAGIVGIRKFAYDIWGDTVNLASRMESHGEVGKVNISGSTCELVKNDFNCTHRGKIHARSRGDVDMYFVGRKA